MTATVTSLLTAEEFAKLPNPADGSSQELVQGRIVQRPPLKGFSYRVATVFK